ncbi:MAG: phosphoribosylglycinamide formyltransferase [Planctomycetota bacterium]|nr:phosphoribosylglycinamide formyltransferase [Planctomycetota bacterium]
MPPIARRPARLGVLISGGGRTMVNLHRACAEGRVPATIGVVAASRECPGCDRARELALPVEVLSGVLDEASFLRLLTQHDIDLVVLAGFLKLVPVPPGWVGRVLNIHPALLPAFGGKGLYGKRVHEAVLASGVRESGCTVHVADAIYDHGPIVLQRRCPVLPGDTPETLAARVFEQELEAYPEAVRLVIERGFAWSTDRA